MKNKPQKKAKEFFYDLLAKFTEGDLEKAGILRVLEKLH